MTKKTVKDPVFESKSYCLSEIKRLSRELMDHKQGKFSVKYSRDFTYHCLKLLANDYKTATRA